MIKYIILGVTLLVIIILYLINKNYIKKDYKRYINNIIKTYNSILIKKDNYKLKDKENIYLKNIDDLFKISYELDKKIIYVLKEHECIFIIEEDNDNLICILKEVEYEK